ncbi:histidinol dehydrogenase [Hyphomonas pacifica]|uniref:Histidinol dehydrogenase n=1 Tax=Hyphomonas pacifica TaxID=1280941 RepID=A0A062U3P6_9PROT|nr:histidinol dehydrogenase [Hyphomonas pacifica]KCZ51214.1 histidinol dehydrogenase [Hyphomonas pacifica]RAN33693.1 histidinol dehydrogenase [Hyphomonas pacifica]RAN35536.1 histidinol dehydrogenase [Hyphomonas pacifica]
MVRHFDASRAAFESEFAAFLKEERGTGHDVADIVSGILRDVQARGGEAVAEYTVKFDKLQIDPATLQSDNVNLHLLAAQCPQDLRDAIDYAHDRIAAYHTAQRPNDHSFTDDAGVQLGWRWTALESVGVYVPGGRASYPSSVLMNVVPAKIAGVERIVMVAPAPEGQLAPAVAYAAVKAGVDEFYPIGGAQAVGALAFGTSSLAPVDKIVGPGNAFVAEAKRQVFGRVGIDTIAGPSEILVIADETANPDWIAADLLSQAEHDPSSQSILITVDKSVGKAVDKSVESQLKSLSTGERAAESWSAHGAIVDAPDLATAANIANQIAPEHLELAIADPDALLPSIRHAGAVFLGHHTPEALGDYVTGSNHVLPTSRAARFSSGLGLYDFLKRMSVQRASPEGFAALAPAALRLAEAERLPAHARSVSIRSNREPD